MADKEKKKGGGSKLTRSETVTVRLDPRLRYLAELGARKQRRTLSSYIEWAIEESLKYVALKSIGDSDYSIADESPKLWDVDEADRFAMLALNYPDLLTHEEQVIWKLIRENGSFWLGRFDADDRWVWHVSRENLIFEKLRTWWEMFKMVAAGEATPNDLPLWPKTATEDALSCKGD